MQIHTAVVARLSGEFHHLQSKAVQVSLNFLELNLPFLNPEEGCEAWVSLDEDRQSAGSLIGELSKKAKNQSTDAKAQFDRFLIQMRDATSSPIPINAEYTIQNTIYTTQNERYLPS